MSLIETLTKSVSAQSPEPLFWQIQSVVEEAIRGRLLQPGDVLPGDEPISQALGINHLTVRKALNGLVEKGLIVRKRGVGTFVCEPDSIKATNVGYFYFRLDEVRKLMVAQGAQAHLAEQQIDLKLVGVDSAFYESFDALETMDRMELTGLILPTSNSDACLRVLHDLEKRGVPHVRVGGITHAEVLSYPLIRSNLPQASRDALAYLDSLGHRQIGLLHFSAPAETVAAFEAHCRLQPDSTPEAALRIRFGKAASSWRAYKEGPLLIRGFLETHPELTAIVVEHPSFAVEILHQCRLMGRTVPEDLAVISLFDHPVLEGAYPPVTAYRARLEDMGRVAAQRLLERLRKAPLVPGHIDCIDHELINRDSVRQRAVHTMETV